MYTDVIVAIEGTCTHNFQFMTFIPKCDACTAHREQMGATTCCSKEKGDQRIHLERVKRERLYYVMRQRLAVLYPTQHLSLIIDGASCRPG